MLFVKESNHWMKSFTESWLTGTLFSQWWMWQSPWRLWGPALKGCKHHRWRLFCIFSHWRNLRWVLTQWFLGWDSVLTQCVHVSCLQFRVGLPLGLAPAPTDQSCFILVLPAALPDRKHGQKIDNIHLLTKQNLHLRESTKHSQSHF